MPVYLTLSAGGSPEQVQQSLEAQINAQLGTIVPNEARAIGEAVKAYARDAMPAGGTISVSLSITTWPYTAAPVPVDSSADEIDLGSAL